MINRKLSEKLQLDPKLTLELAIRQAKQSEMVKEQQSLLHNDDKTTSANVDRVRKTKPVKQKKTQAPIKP